MERNTIDLVSGGTAIDHGKLDNTLDEGNPRQRHRTSCGVVSLSVISTWTWLSLF